MNLKPISITRIILVILSMAAVYNYFRGVSVEITNRDLISIHNIGVHVTGNSYYIGTNKPGEKKTVRVFPTNDSDIEIEMANGKRLVVDVYIESHVRGTIEVEFNMKQIIKKKQSTRMYGIL